MFRLKFEFPQHFLAQVVHKHYQIQKLCLIHGNLLGVLTAKPLEDFNLFTYDC